uniref:FKBP-type peptidyl-prolyl cis-trans isomerase n=1 Tax=Limnohabitans sp. TaxID=1907725 RepID=UPI004047B5D4
MKIAQDTVVTMQYKVTNAQGMLLDKAQEPTSYLHGGYDNTFPKIESALEGQEVGFATTLKLTPADAFGERDESLVQ